MKKLLVFLHGFGLKRDENSEFVATLANKIDADAISLESALPSGRARGGFAWFPLRDADANGHRAAITDGFIQNSANFIRAAVDNLLLARGQNWDDVILCGRSQGGFMAMYIALGRERERELRAANGDIAVRK